MKMRTKWEWSNWTIGLWWGTFSRSRSAPNHFGLELGPLQIVWSWKKVK